MRGATLHIPCTESFTTQSSSQFLCSIDLLMALASDRNIQDIQARINCYGSQGLDHAFSLELFGCKGAANMSMLDDGGGSDSLGSYSASLLPMLSDPNNCTSSSYLFGATGSPPEEAQILGPWTTDRSSSLLSFDRAGYASLDHEDESMLWIDTIGQNRYLDPHTKHGATDQNFSRLIHEDQSCFDMVSCGHGLLGEKRCGNDWFGLQYPSASAVDSQVVQENMAQAKGLGQKRQIACTDGDMPLPSPKKQCPANKKSKDMCSPSKDPQSLAAKNRRERISERLKVLQDLVPNGTKVDLVTMLEKAITYVKFLQLQVKVLATDEFWPAQGRKAPELSQVKEAVDSILFAQRENVPSLNK